ncbi:hypothetical protein NIES593_05215 [Hydrococcus rivularis NIES-593]|uniref:Uncharacterized protein n=1 Tax=Hydrococcus rivularis NIES-593 TaxID=1921803 RepID=A0A1U7HNM8_9CYAN|nr:hypothetical protein NIES593_05215 [Hydrococcus rivularis NIES-593]
MTPMAIFLARVRQAALTRYLPDFYQTQGGFGNVAFIFSYFRGSRSQTLFLQINLGFRSSKATCNEIQEFCNLYRLFKLIMFALFIASKNQ